MSFWSELYMRMSKQEKHQNSSRAKMKLGSVSFKRRQAEKWIAALGQFRPIVTKH